MLSQILNYCYSQLSWAPILVATPFFCRVYFTSEGSCIAHNNLLSQHQYLAFFQRIKYFSHDNQVALDFALFLLK